MKKVIIKKNLVKGKKSKKISVNSSQSQDLAPLAQESTPITHPRSLLNFFKAILWFVIGFCFAGFLLASITVIYFEKSYKDKVIPGVFVDNIYVGEKTRSEVKKLFDDKNAAFEHTALTLTGADQIATVSAKDIGIGYDSNLISTQAVDMGKSTGLLSNVYTLINSYLNGTYLKSSYTFQQQKLKELLSPIQAKIYKEPVDAQFKVENNRVIAFKESENGQDIDYQALEGQVQKSLHDIVINKKKFVEINLPLKTVEPKLTTEKANSFGIVEVIGTGTSFFAHSIPNRIHNVSLAASRVNGILVAPGEDFSFTKYLGDVSSLTGYKEAYVIQNGKTVLGDGGGVCQVSTTLFRAALNAGLPITERHPHSYRVGYYEEGGFMPGMDATVYYPTVDLKFKNDTGNYILVQNIIDLENLQLTYILYGKKDGREVSMTTPVIKNRVSPPPPSYQDDPNLPKGVVKQIDFAAEGATASFHRTVTKDGKVIIDEDFVTRYAPWQAVFLKGTKES